MFTLSVIGAGLVLGSVVSLSSVLLPSPSSLKLTPTLNAAFMNLKLGIHQGEQMLYPLINQQIDYPWGIRLLCSLPTGLSSKKVIEQSAAISEALRYDVEIYWHKGLIIDVFQKELPKSIPFEQVEKRNDYKVAIGVNKRLEPVYYDFAGSFPHLLIGGISGGGKSVLLRSILTQLCMNQPLLYLGDMKGGVELNLFKNLQNTVRFSTNLAQLEQMAAEVEHEMNKRYEIMERNGTQEWEGKKIIFVLDELADLKSRAKDPDAAIKANIKAKLTNISAKGRASAVTLILCTQRPDASIVDGLIKTNIATSICFRTRDATQSRIILDSNDAADLPDVPGRAIFQQAHDVTVQSFYLPYKTARELLKPYECQPITNKIEGVIHEQNAVKTSTMDNNIDELE